MDHLELLDLAADEFRRRLHAVPADAWGASTPCEGWDVEALVTHVVGGNHMAVAMLGGADLDEVMATVAGFALGEDPMAGFEQSAAAQREAFRRPGALEATVHHPAGDIPAAQLLGFRIGDLGVHAWDLARATGGDEALDPRVVEAIWHALEPMRPVIGQVGVFGSGPSGELGDDAPLQQRLLDLVGRRP